MYGCNTSNYGGMVIHTGATISERSLGNEHCKFLYNGFKTFLLSKVTPFEARFMKTVEGICYIWACSLIRHYNIYIFVHTMSFVILGQIIYLFMEMKNLQLKSARKCMTGRLRV